MLTIEWSTSDGASGSVAVGHGGRFVIARRMALPEHRDYEVTALDGSQYMFVRRPYVSDPALIVTMTEQGPSLYRGQRANGAIVEVLAPGEGSFVPAVNQHISITATGTRIALRLPDFGVSLTLNFVARGVSKAESGTAPLSVEALDHDDLWLIAALAVAMSPVNGVVAHGDLKSAFARWRGISEPSAGAFDRNVLRPALTTRGVELPGPRLNKILYLVERCRATGEFPDMIVTDLRNRLSELGFDI